jgi:hypothetical protein
VLEERGALSAGIPLHLAALSRDFLSNDLDLMFDASKGFELLRGSVAKRASYYARQSLQSALGCLQQARQSIITWLSLHAAIVPAAPALLKCGRRCRARLDRPAIHVTVSDR